MMSKPIIVLLILIFLALVANLAFVVVTDKSFIDGKSVQYGLFGVLILANGCVAGAGFYFVTKTHQKHEKSSLVWARRAYASTILVNALLAMAPWVFIKIGTYEVTRSEALQDVSIVLLLLGVPTALFAMAFYRDFRRVSGSRSTPRSTGASDYQDRER